MKALPFAAVLAIATTLTACSDEGADGLTNVERVQYFYDAYTDNDAELLDLVLASDIVSIPSPPDRDPGLEAFKASIDPVNQIFEDLTITPDQILEDGNFVVVRSRVTGVQVGNFSGIPAQDRPIDIMAIDIHEFNDDGLVVEIHHVEDWLTGMFQMGAFDQ
ncbi:MAG: ester cyclase [Myxococcota bacterium]